MSFPLQLFSSTLILLTFASVFVFANTLGLNFDIFSIDGNRIINKVTIKHNLTEIPQKYIVAIHTFNLTTPEDDFVENKYYYNKELVDNYNVDSIQLYSKEKARTFIGSIAHLKDAYVNYAASVVTQEMQFLDIAENGPKCIREKKDDVVMGNEFSIIAFGHNTLCCFSHWFYDFLSPLTLVPDYVIASSKVIILAPLDYMYKTLKAFGINEDQVIVANRKWIFARNIYIALNPAPHLSHFGPLMVNMSRILRDYFQLDKIKATRYCLSNRNAIFRHISNFDEIVKAVNDYFGPNVFEVVEDDQSVEKAAKNWASMKFLYVPTGSNCIKCMFMKHGSVIVIALGDVIDYTPGFTASLNGIFCLFYSNYEMKHFTKGPNYLNVTKALTCIKLGYKCCQLGHWEPEEVYHEPGY